MSDEVRRAFGSLVSLLRRAVANGPVGPAMAGPILFYYIFWARIIIEPGLFSILFLKQRRHSRQNVHSDDSVLGRFRPSHAGSHHHSMGGNGPQVHEFVGLYSDPQCDAGTITAVVTYVFFRLNLPLNKFRRQCYKFRRQCYKFRRQCYDGVGNMSGQRTVLLSACRS